MTATALGKSMPDTAATDIQPDRCLDLTYRLSVYEAGHALTARALGLKLISVRMLPRPPVLISDKVFANDKLDAFTETLEIRIIELYGGQIAEEHACGTNTCCSGDIARIDELSRIVAALTGVDDPETVMFDLEDAAREIFTNPSYLDAILPIAEFLCQRVTGGQEIIDGPDIEAEMDKYLPAAPSQSWLKRVFSFG